MIVCAILLSNYLNADGAVFGGLLYIFITIVLMIVFIPKVGVEQLLLVALYAGVRGGGGGGRGWVEMGRERGRGGGGGKHLGIVKAL